MCDNEQKDIQVEQEDLNETFDALPVVMNKSEAIATELMDTEDPQKIKELINLFNIQAKKKSIHRAVKVNDMLDNIVNTLHMRIITNPDQFQNFELLNFLERLDAYYETAIAKDANPNDNSLISLTQNNQINIISDNNGLNTQSRKNVTEAVRKILENIQKETLNIIEVDETDE